MEIKVKGFFQFKTGLPDGTITKETPVFENVVLDQGIRKMNSSSDNISYLNVGTGNSEPNPSQTGLDNRVAYVSIGNYYGSLGQDPDDTDHFYIEYSKTVRFDAGTFNNVTLSEVGLGFYTLLWNRALIRDESGLPTTITVLKEEFLDVTFKYRLYYPVNTRTKSINITNKEGTVVKTINATMGFFIEGSGTSFPNGNRPLFSDNTAFIVNSPIEFSKYPGRQSSIIHYSNVTYLHNVSSSSAVQARNRTDNNVTYSIFTQPPSFNEPIYGLLTDFGSDYNRVSFYVNFSEPIQKTNEETMSLSVSLSYGRYTKPSQ